MGGNTPDSLSGPDIVSPPAIEAREFMTASWMTRFPAVFAVISRPSKIDTPDDTNVPSVRVKRATAAFRCRSPRIGKTSISLSMASRPPSVLYAYRIRKTEAITPASSAHQ